MKKFAVVLALVAALFIGGGSSNAQSQECVSPDAVLMQALSAGFIPDRVVQGDDAGKLIKTIFQKMDRADEAPAVDLIVVFETPDGRIGLFGFEVGCLTGRGIVTPDEFAELLTLAFGRGA